MISDAGIGLSTRIRETLVLYFQK